MQKIVRIFTIFLFLMLFIGISSIAEEITVTTYYPAPYGVYEEFLVSKLAVGSSVTIPTNDGYLEAGGKIQTNELFNINGSDGYDMTYTVVTDVEIAGINLKQKKRDIEVTGGITTDVGNEKTEQVGQIN